MRRPLAALLSLFTALTLLPVASASADSPPTPIVADARIVVGTDGKATPYVRLIAADARATVDFRFRLKGSSEAYASIPGVPRREAGGEDAAGSVWSPETTAALQQGRTYLDIRVNDPSGGRTEMPQVAFLDRPSGIFTLGAGGGGWVTDAFDAQATVTHSGQVSRVVARLYRAGTTEQVGEDVVPTVRQTAELPGGVTRTVYMTGPVFDPPAGRYQVAMTAWDGQGDSLTSRTAIFDKRLEQRLTDVRVTGTLDYEHRGTVVTGRVTDTAGAPLGGVTVSLNTPEAKTTTADDGSFALEVTPTASRASLTAASHGAYISAKANVEFPFRAQATRVSLSPVPSAGRVGDKVTLSGLLERQNSAGAWVPLPGRPVKLSFTSDGTKQTTDLGTPTTGPDGRYSLTTKVTGSGTWRVDSAASPFLENSMAGEYRRTSFWTRIIGVTARPNPVAVGGKVTLTGQIVRTGAPAGSTNVANVPVSLTFSPGPGRMFGMAEGRTDANGRFSLSGIARSDGTWWVSFSGGAGIGGTLDEPSGTSHLFVDAKYKTAISSFNASPEPVKKGRTLTVKGRITKQAAKWQPGAGATLTVYFKPSGSSKWKAMGTTKADRNGWFTKGFKASADGTWAAAYAGSPSYLGVWSTGDYVDVR
ncbi:hypothetical protein DZF91_00665 [Actinomadura logoneensis]|uniref:Carboxypeptidase regulatory-like domain-containing protein n=1 Tax=Actinomadura logoneensis TaxID=2293572 RepID=A0A372JU29_9ACTN|nr:carboxypeptidase regulatory-like domain-containing protein [Actinomadura logoneensis]RFU43541.1 hypothetical protein DZF91_00665 [Actinomadura logoneensis]